LASAALAVVFAAPAYAQGPDARPPAEGAKGDRTSPAEAAKGERPAPAEAAKAEPAAEPVVMAKAPPGVPPWRKSDEFPLALKLQLHGGFETDVGYAKYTYDTPTFTPEDFYDFRGRFVLSPSLRYDMSRDLFFRGVGQFVAWIRETYNTYLVNVDDVFVQVGQNGSWDFMLGRFMTWRVYRKGLGYDLYTLEDTGALKTPTLEGGNFGVHVYEVDNIFYRGTPGRAALHVYPTSWSGLELAGEYGKDGTSNSVGGRAAGNVTYDFVSISAAGEYRTFRPAVDNSPSDANGNKIECAKCGLVQRYGFGGGAVFKLRPLEAGVNGARAFQKSYDLKEGQPDKNGFFKTTSLGGYLQLDVGTLLMNHGLVLGTGLNRTERLFDNDDFERHTQWAWYVGYPLGFNDAMIKVVISKSDEYFETPVDRTLGTYRAQNSRMLAGRVRVKFDF
jgi:hypothetical protein